MEITLYNVSGSPEAYIADNGEDIYLWSGKVVAYVNNERIFGWNGRHLGWFIDGVVYDLSGRRVGFAKGKCPVAVYAEPAKFAKFAKPARCAKCASYARSALSTAYSDIELVKFLEEGS